MGMKKFFSVLNQNLVIECFIDKSYRMLITIPKVSVHKLQQNIWIAEEFFSYLHPFSFPDLFKKKLTNDQSQVLFKIVKIFISSSARKEFNIQQFLDSYSWNLNVTGKKRIENSFTSYLKILH